VSWLNVSRFVKLHNLPVQFNIQAIGSDCKFDDMGVFPLVCCLTEITHEYAPARSGPLESIAFELRRVPFVPIKRTPASRRIIRVVPDISLARPGRRVCGCENAGPAGFNNRPRSQFGGELVAQNRKGYWGD
jgi:hypothetical protein